MADSLGNRTFQGIGFTPEQARRLDDIIKQIGQANQNITLNRQQALSKTEARAIAQEVVGQATTQGLSITITTAKLTSGGKQGSMQFTNGVLTAQTQAS